MKTTEQLMIPIPLHPLAKRPSQHPPKPRLKLYTNGHVELLTAGRSAYSGVELKKIIQQRYTSIKVFALTFGLDYQACIEALGDYSEKRGGYVAQVRNFLGLPSNPTPQANKVAALKASRYGHSLPSQLSVRASRKPERPASSGVATHSEGRA
jgi:hypothetical protein